MDRIILIAQQIAKEGKTPNTASIKARLPKNIPLPLIIQGLKAWQDNPKQAINNPTEPPLTAYAGTDNNASIDALIDARINAKIEQAIHPLQAQIIHLTNMLETLQNSNQEEK